MRGGERKSQFSTCFYQSAAMENMSVIKTKVGWVGGGGGDAGLNKIK